MPGSRPFRCFDGDFAAGWLQYGRKSNAIAKRLDFQHSFDLESERAVDRLGVIEGPHLNILQTRLESFDRFGHRFIDGCGVLSGLQIPPGEIREAVID
jgi:hypothetical protein